MMRGTDLAHHEHIELCAEWLCDLECDGHATTRQRKHDGVAEIGIEQQRGESTPSVPPVLEPHGCLLNGRVARHPSTHRRRRCVGSWSSNAQVMFEVVGLAGIAPAQNWTRAMQNHLQAAGRPVQHTAGAAEPAGSHDHSFMSVYEPDPGELGRLRRELRAWLSPLGYRSVDVADVVLATSEAAANAIEHGASPDGFGVSVVGTVADR